MQVGELAERVRLSNRTVRYYDDQGLLTSARSAGNYRLYSEADVERMMLIRRMKPLGYTLEQMRDVLALLDALDGRTDGAAAPAGAPAGRAGLQDVVEDVQQRRERLAEQLVSADEFLASLRQRLEGL